MNFVKARIVFTAIIMVVFVSTYAAQKAYGIDAAQMWTGLNSMGSKDYDSVYVISNAAEFPYSYVMSSPLLVLNWENFHHYEDLIFLYDLVTRNQLARYYRSIGINDFSIKSETVDNLRGDEFKLERIMMEVKRFKFLAVFNQFHDYTSKLPEVFYIISSFDLVTFRVTKYTVSFSIH